MVGVGVVDCAAGGDGGCGVEFGGEFCDAEGVGEKEEGREGEVVGRIRGFVLHVDTSCDYFGVQIGLALGL